MGNMFKRNMSTNRVIKCNEMLA